MERLREARGRRGLVGKLTSDPAVAAAAAAVTLGVDPSWVLDQPLEDLPIVEAILQLAQEQRVKYDEDFAAAIGASTAQKLLPPLAKHITRLAQAIDRAARRRPF